MKIRKISDKEIFIRSLIALAFITFFYFIGGKEAIYAIGTGLAVGTFAIIAGRI